MCDFAFLDAAIVVVGGLVGGKRRLEARELRGLILIDRLQAADFRLRLRIGSFGCLSTAFSGGAPSARLLLPTTLAGRMASPEPFELVAGLRRRARRGPPATASRAMSAV